MEQMHAKNSGFTLIELMVVISIISLLSSMLFTAVGSVRAKARDSVRIQGLNSIRNALNLYASNNGGSFPSGHYFTSHYNTGDMFDWNILKNTLSPYISTLPMDPLNDTTYWWVYTSSFHATLIYANPPSPEIGQAAAGTCYGKALLMIRSNETGINKKECKLENVSGYNLQSAYANAIILLLN